MHTTNKTTAAAATHVSTCALSNTQREQVPLGGHPSYGKHSWTINLISIMVTHERGALPRFMMANWCWYTPNVALINTGRERRTRAAKMVYIIVNEKKQLPLLKVLQRLTEVRLQTARARPAQRIGQAARRRRLGRLWAGPAHVYMRKWFDIHCTRT